MTIASEITKLNTNLTNSYTAVSGKGGTLPSAQNFDNLATAIDSIPSGTTPVISSLSITPSKSNQTYNSSSVDGYKPVTVSAVTSSIDSNIKAANIKNGVDILGVTGTYSGTTPTGTLSITANGVYDVTNYASADVSVSGGGGGKYKLLQRVRDDSNNDIGMVFGFYTDANDVEYAVVCLNAKYRLASGKWAASTQTVTNMPLYGSVDTAAFGSGTETAKANCDLILAFTTSTAITHCRSKSFVINGTTYYGQLPNINELLQMFAMHYKINADDPTASSTGTSLNFAFWKNTWSSSQYSYVYGWYVSRYGATSYTGKTTDYFVAPVLEIPNT